MNSKVVEGRKMNRLKKFHSEGIDGSVDSQEFDSNSDNMDLFGL